jgi:hypothetical protein
MPVGGNVEFSMACGSDAPDAISAHVRDWSKKESESKVFIG